jgi:hypothetical protein
MFESTQLLAIRWTWYQDPAKFSGTDYIPPETFLEWERDSEHESSCEVEYFGGDWWCCSNSFGLVLNPNSPIRRVWASDVHTYCDRKGQLVADDNPSSAHTAIGWEGVYKKMPKWRKHAKTWWSEGTFPPKPDVVAFAMMEDPSEDALYMWECAKNVFGDLPVITIAGHPNAVEETHLGWCTFDPFYRKNLGVRLWSHAWHPSKDEIGDCSGYMDDFGNLILVEQTVMWN